MTASTFLMQRFALGRTLITPAARDHLAAHHTGEAALVERHATGDWGDLDVDDARQNDVAVRRGFRILSQYRVGGEMVWIETSADRGETLVVMALEY
jgi:hypothetical protein